MKNIISILFLFFTASVVKAQELQYFILEAENNNPEIKAFNLRYSIAEEKVNEVNWVPNTEFSAGYFVSEPETRTGPQRARFSARQMLPWFGTITARENYATAMANAEYIEIVIAKRKLSLSVSQSYFGLYEIKAQQRVLSKNVLLLKTYEKIALKSLEVGKASAVDVLRLQIRQNELQQQKDVLDEAYLAAQISFNKLLHREGTTALIIPNELFLPNEDVLPLKRVLALNPELLLYDKRYESVAKEELLNKNELNPMIGFGLDYIPVSERTDMNFNDNGKDVFMPMMTVSIPLFNNKFKSITKQNELRQLEINSQKESRLNILESAFAKAISQLNQAKIQYYTQEKNLQQAQDAEEILIENYQTGTIDFNDILDIQELQLKFQMNQIESVQMYYVQQSIINYLIS
jgi:outer membrane protein TolC